MRRDARSCRRPAIALTPRWHGLPPTSPPSRVAGPCSGSSATRAFSTLNWIETSPAIPGMPPARPQPIGAIFLAAVRDRPLAYAGKFIRQMAYGASVAWPPYGLDPTIPGVDRRRAPRVRYHDAARPDGSAD